MVSNNFYVHPYLGKIPILTNIFQMGGSTTNQKKESTAIFQMVVVPRLPGYRNANFKVPIESKNSKGKSLANHHMGVSKNRGKNPKMDGL